VLKLMFPVTIGLGLINFNLSVDSIFATFISDEAPAAIDKAFRIYMLPQGVFAVALATVIFPTLSRLAARGDTDGLRVTVGTGTRQMLFLLVPATALLLALSEPVTRVLYQRGEFDAAQTELVSEALFYFAFSLPFAGVNLILIRAFFSLQRPWTPTMIALGNLGINAGLDALLYKPVGIGGIPLSTAIVSLLTTVLLAAVLRTMMGGLDARRTLYAALRIAVAGTIAFGVALAIKLGLDAGLADSFGDQLAVILVAGTAGTAAYAAAVWMLRVHEARAVWGLLSGQFARLRRGT
jgi:putative peptidoglycan lipid II flippase